MAAHETRLLVLGAVMLFEPVNGYQIRRELLSWGVEEWARIRPGSIYSVLKTLSGQGHLARHDLPDGQRTVAVYTSTPAGRRELARLYRDGLERYRPFDPLPFQTALTLLPLVTREEFLVQLRRRMDDVREQRAEVDRQEVAVRDTAPPHVARVIGFWSEAADAELAWMGRLLRDVEAGALTFQDEPTDWQPAADDPSWQMARDRRKYTALLGR